MMQAAAEVHRRLEQSFLQLREAATARLPGQIKTVLQTETRSAQQALASASKKRIRNANRTPKNLKNWEMCKVCNKPKLAHRMCDEMRCFENEALMELRKRVVRPRTASPNPKEFYALVAKAFASSRTAASCATRGEATPL